MITGSNDLHLPTRSKLRVGYGGSKLPHSRELLFFALVV
jgi:P pilus assembly chaperone PapD